MKNSELIKNLNNEEWINSNTKNYKCRSVDLWEHTDKDDVSDLVEGRKLRIEYKSGESEPEIYFFNTKKH